IGPSANGVVVWFAQDKGFLPMKYQLTDNGRVTEEMQVDSLGKSDYRGNEFWFPARARLLTGPGVCRTEYAIYAMTPNPLVDDSTFRLDFPAGYTVFDGLTE